MSLTKTLEAKFIPDKGDEKDNHLSVTLKKKNSDGEYVNATTEKLGGTLYAFVFHPVTTSIVDSLSTHGSLIAVGQENVDFIDVINFDRLEVHREPEKELINEATLSKPVHGGFNKELLYGQDLGGLWLSKSGLKLSTYDTGIAAYKISYYSKATIYEIQSPVKPNDVEGEYAINNCTFIGRGNDGEIVTASIDAKFKADNRDDIAIPHKMEMHRNGYSKALVRHYPSYFDSIHAVIGQVRSKGVTGLLDVENELIDFNGDTATPSYPVSQITKGLALASPILDADTLKPVSNVSVFFNSNTGQFEANRAIIATGEVSYKTDYVILEYKGGSFGDRENVRGKIISVLNGKTATFNVPTYELDDGRDRIEVARVESFYLLAEADGERGAYEMPNNWGGDNAHYPHNNHPVPDEEGSYEATRCHECLMLTPEGQFFRERNNPAIFAPYVGVYSYHPKYKLKKGNSREKWAQQYINSFDWDSYYKVLEERYKGIEL